MTPSDSGKGGEGLARAGHTDEREVFLGEEVFLAKFYTDEEAAAIIKTINAFFRAHIAAGFVRKEEYDRLNGNMKVTQSLLDKAAAALPDDPTELEDMKEKLEALRRVAGEMAECFKQIKPEYLNTFFFPSDLERVLARFDAWDKQNPEGGVPPTEKKDLTDSKGRL